MEKKHLRINTGILTAAGDKTGIIGQYESIKLNAGTLIASAKNLAAISARAKRMNVGMTIEVPENAEVKLVNGSADITPGDLAPENTALIVNGTLHVHEGAGEALARYVLIHLNGVMYAPESLRSAVTRIQKCGAQHFYPDGAEFVDGDIIIDRRFVKRAAEDGMWYATGKACPAGPGIDIAALIDKNIIIRAEKAYVSADYPDAEMLFDSETNIEVVPSGCRLIRGDLNITDDTADFHGSRLYVLGCVTVGRDGASGLEKLEKLIFRGSAQVHERALDMWKKRASGDGSLEVTDDAKTVSETDTVCVSRAMLEACPDGVRIEEASTVLVAADVEPALLAERVRRIEDCGCVVCTQEQQAVLQLVSECVNFAREPAAEPEKKKEELPGDGEIVRINAGMHSI